MKGKRGERTRRNREPQTYPRRETPIPNPSRTQPVSRPATPGHPLGRLGGTTAPPEGRPSPRRAPRWWHTKPVHQPSPTEVGNRKSPAEDKRTRECSPPGAPNPRAEKVTVG